MKINQKLQSLFLVTAIGTMITFSSCKKDDDPVPVPPVAGTTITDVVVGNSAFTLLKQAVLKAGLDTTLKGAGPFTVFAPDDAAFTAGGFTSTVIGSAAVTPAALKAILLYHTIPGKILAAGVPVGPNAKVITAGGDSVFVTNNTNGVFVNGVKVTAADVPASNGVIHKVGRVILPPAGNIVETATAAGLDSLVKAILRAKNGAGGDPNIVTTLSTATLTVFAPTNAAFTQLLTALGVNNIDLISPATLATVLKYHVVVGRTFSSGLVNAASVPMVAGGNTTIGLTATSATIKGNNTVLTLSVGGSTNNICNITATTDVMCRNGVVHLIDRVLLP
jgi:uncharacterized surface protein with fasciclin (FAS1) repeats